MVCSKYVAHRTEDGRLQSIKDHLEGTASLCADFASRFGAEDVGRLCGLAHDIGKYSVGFQNRILNDGKKVDHATAGAIECWRLRQAYAAMCVMGHHGGLMDLGVTDATADDDSFYGRKRRYEQVKPYDYSAWEQEVTLPQASVPPLQNFLQRSYYTRMLFSCLVDADFLDTASFMGEPREGVSADWDDLNARLDTFTKDWYPPATDLNRIRCGILDACKVAGEASEDSLYTLIVPTGGGKTVSSLAFALRHARRTGKDRIIYVIPYTSIIEQTAEVFREILGEDVVLEHHSGIVYDDGEDGKPDERQKRMKYASENWDMPIVVTTAVQFFESLYDNRPSHCRKLHNIANSVVIFDEAQMLPLPYLRPCVYAIAELTRAYRVTAVLCTATQPALDPLFREYLEKAPREICPSALRNDDIFKRVTFRKNAKLTTTELAERLNACKQVLCVVNTRAAAQELFQLLDGEGRFHLSTLMYPAERQRQLAVIRKRLEDGQPCRVVSTSLIEAGVDVDFRTVYREEAGLDSVLQAAGRCNRNGAVPCGESEVFVFTAEWKVPKMLGTAISASRYVWDGDSDPSAEETIHRYFEEYLFLKGKESQDTHGVLDKMNQSTLPFETVAHQFHLIESNAITVYIPTEESRPLIEQYRNGFITRALMRRLGRFGVTVYPNHLQALLDAGDVEALGGEVYVLCNEEMYGEQTGLSVKVDQGRAIIL